MDTEEMRRLATVAKAHLEAAQRERNMAITYNEPNLTTEAPQAQLEGAIIEIRKELLDLTQRYEALKEEYHQARLERDARYVEVAQRLGEAVQASRKGLGMAPVGLGPVFGGRDAS